MAAKKKEKYTASAKIVGRTYEAQGATIMEALENMQVPAPKALCVLTLSKGDKRQERIISRVIATRLFTASPITRQLAIKQMSLMFAL